LKGTPSGKAAERIERLAQRMGKTLPQGFLSNAKGANITGLELWWIAFWELRASTPAEEPIRWLDREMWARAHGLDYGRRERLHVLIAGMDAEFRKWFRKKQESSERGLSRGKST
jgi:hypothetical protein